MVPNGWEVKKLEDLCAPDAPITYGVLKPGEYCSNGIPLLQIKDLSNGQVSSQDLHLISKELDEEYKRSRILKNDILISLVGTIGRVAKFELSTPANIHRNLGRIRTDYHEFIFHFLNSDVALKLMGDSSSGSSQSALNLSTLRAMKVPFPPFKEQQKIAQILTTWDQAISATEKLLENSQQQKKALMQQLLTGKKRLLDENGVEFSEAWQLDSFGDWIEEYNEKSTVNEQYEVLTSARKGLIKQSEYFGDNRISQRDNIGFNIIPSGYITYRSRSDDGSFFFNRNDYSFNGIISTYYPVFHFPTGDNSFFLYLLNRNSSYFSPYSVGTSQKVLSLNALKSVKIKVPKKTEQQKIAQVITLADQEVETLQKKLDCLKQEKKALMQQLLTGKKRVKVAA
jgi:type I restriction enzyme S subunit